MKKWIWALFTAMTFSWSAYAAIEVYEFDNLQQEQQFKELGNTLRCPKCQNNTIADSNAALAQDLRHKVYEMTKEGKSKQEIIDYMVARYGNFVTYNPPLTVATSILWLGPLSVLLIGFSLIILRSRKRKAVSASEQEKWDAEKEARLKALLQDENNGDKQ
ncbi:cystathionine gamma-synthase [Vibrio navarrensis]|uniref:cytochrome c-type biogenesis protein n=1 Tax=Vibrio navarrensis TaxID=29495 RepID=UPI00052D14A5|nr:cytochrome c-type biogenesis protein [Vibrio navarrensis]KGK22413.1 cystathionine gamma-synthase [Vibrio navarrensis]MBE4573992.1 cytochrome c-type biogenesis protein CcmH [Vibrio navarrensis]